MQFKRGAFTFDGSIVADAESAVAEHTELPCPRPAASTCSDDSTSSSADRESDDLFLAMFKHVKLSYKELPFVHQPSFFCHG